MLSCIVRAARAPRRLPHRTAARAPAIWSCLSAASPAAAYAMATAASATATEFSSEKLSLAMIILGEQFGNIVKAVGATMLRRGQMTLTDLVRYVDMPGQKRRLGEPGALSAESSRNRRLEAQRERLLRESLMVLLHHNIATCAPVKRGSERLDTHVYSVHIDDIVHRLSHPKYCEHIRSRYEQEQGIDVELLLLSVFKQGKVSRRQAVEMALSEAKLLGGARRHGGPQVVAALEAAWDRLKEDRYIVEAQTFADIEVAVDPDAAEYDSEDGPAANSPTSKRGGKRAAASAATSPGRSKRRKAGNDDAGGDEVTRLTESALWRVDVQLVRRELRHQACITLVRHKRGDASAELVQIMLQHGRHEESDSAAELSRAIPIEQIYDHLPKDGLISEWSSAQLEAKLDELYRDELEICVRTQQGGRWGWAVNLKSIALALKQHCAGSVVKGESGEVGARIFRMLILQKKLEQKQIEKAAMVKMKEARTTL